MPTVFVVWDSKVLELADLLKTAAVLLSEQDVQLHFLGDDRYAQGDIVRNVRDGIRQADAILVLLDQANVNVAWELGLALAAGKPVGLACSAQQLPDWLKGPPLRRQLVATDVDSGGQIAHLARKLLAADDALDIYKLPEKPIPAGEDTLLLHSQAGQSGDLGELVGSLDNGWRRPAEARWGLDDLPDLLEGLRRVVILVPQPRRRDVRDDPESTRLAILAAYAHGRGVRVDALVHQPPGVKDQREFADLGEVWSFVPDVRAAAAKIRGWMTPSEQETAADPLQQWREQMRARHADLLLFKRPGTAATQRVRLDMGLVADLCVRAGRERRLDGTLGEVMQQLSTPDPKGRVGRLVLVAEPGAGKSTTLRQVTWEAAGGGHVVPVFLSLASQAGEQPFAAAEKMSGVRGLAAALTAAASKPGRVWLLLDGLDEVAPEQLGAVCDWLTGLAVGEQWRNVVLVVSTRPVVVERQGLHESFQRVHLSRLDAEQQQRLLRVLEPVHADRLWQAVQGNVSLADLVSNPLMLTLFAVTGAAVVQGTLDREAPVLAVDRVQLYRRAVALLLGGHQRGRTPVRDEELAEQVLSRLALELQTGTGEAWGLTTLASEVLTLCVEDQALGTRLKFLWGTPMDFLADVGKESSLLGPADGEGGPWRFLHRTLREYLAAVALQAAGEQAIAQWVAGWKSALKAEAEARENAEAVAVPAARWGEVYALLCGMDEDPVRRLSDLQKVSAELFVRALRSVDGLPAEQVMSWLWPMQVRGWRDGLESRDWNGDDLEVALTRTGTASTELAALLWARVHADVDTERLGILYVALERLAGPVNADAFFRECKRPRPRQADPFELIPPASSTDAGSFLMGSPEGVGDPREHPQHAVQMNPFRLGRSTVTRAQYKRFDPEHTCPGGEEHPVTRVSWYEARLYAAWVGGTLPSEAQWEYACRAPRHAEDSTAWWCGDDEQQLAEVAWYNENSGIKVHPVGADGHANRWGLQDMHGNVSEWCQDGLRDYVSEPEHDPLGPPHGRRVIRGGFAWYVADRCRSAFRGGRSPELRVDYVGFRVRWPSPADDP